jgi:hypothetical protein
MEKRALAAKILASDFRALGSPSRGQKLYGQVSKKKKLYGQVWAHFGEPIFGRQSKQGPNFVGTPIF